jgi:hypothetical protein
VVPIFSITGAVQLLLKFVCFPQHSGTLSGYSEEADVKICGKMHPVPLVFLRITTIELGTAEKENFQTPCAALAQHPRITSLPTATCLHEDLLSMADW